MIKLINYFLKKKKEKHLYLILGSDNLLIFTSGQVGKR